MNKAVTAINSPGFHELRGKSKGDCSEFMRVGCLNHLRAAMWDDVPDTVKRPAMPSAESWAVLTLFATILT